MLCAGNTSTLACSLLILILHHITMCTMWYEVEFSGCKVDPWSVALWVSFWFLYPEQHLEDPPGQGTQCQHLHSFLVSSPRMSAHLQWPIVSLVPTASSSHSSRGKCFLKTSWLRHCFTYLMSIDLFFLSWEIQCNIIAILIFNIHCFSLS